MKKIFSLLFTPLPPEGGVSKSPSGDLGVNNKIFSNKWLHFFLLAGTTFFVFYPSLFCALTNWDAIDLIAENLLIRSISFENIKKIFGHFYWFNYQPLTLLSYAVEYHFFGINSFVIHLDNVILHICNALLVYCVIFMLTGDRKITLIASFLWAVHPLRVESVTWVVERKDVLYSFFFLLSLIHYLYYLRKTSSGLPSYVHAPKHSCNPAILYSLSLLFFILACFAKGMAVSLTLLLPLVDFFLRRKLTVRAVMDKIPFLCISLFFGMIVLFAVEDDPEDLIKNVHPLFERIMYSGYGIFFYLFKFCWPFNLAAIYPYYPGGEQPFYYALLTLVSVAVISAAFYSLLFTRKIAFAFGIYLASVFFVLQFKETNVAPVADRYSYIGHIGICLLTAWIAEYLGRFINKEIYRRIYWSFLCVIIILLCIRTRQQVHVWNNDVSLWQNSIQNNEHPSALINLAIGYQNKGDFKMALRYYDKAVSKSLLYRQVGALAFNGRGNLKRILSDNKGAIADFRLAIKKNPLFRNAYLNYGGALLTLKKYDTAIVLFNKVIEIDPGNHKGFFNRGSAWSYLQQYDSALNDYNRAIRINPYNPKYYKTRGDAFSVMQKYDSAVRDYDMVIQKFKWGGKEIFFNRGLAKISLADSAGGCADLSEAYRLGYPYAALVLQQYCRRFIPPDSLSKMDKPLHARTIFYPDGKVKLEIRDALVNRQIVKILKHYNNKGNLIEEGILDTTGKYNGEIKWYYDNGYIKTVGFYRDSVPYGNWSEFYENRNKKAEYGYVNGKLHGSYKYFHSNGLLWTERVYNEGKLMDVKVIYDFNGNALDDGDFQNGNGTLKVYDENGKITATETYRDGYKITLK